MQKATQIKYTEYNFWQNKAFAIATNKNKANCNQLFNLISSPFR